MLRAARDRKNRRAVVISRRQHLLPAAGLTIGSFPVVHVHDLLGVFIDSDVSMRTRVQRIASRCFISLRQLRSVRRQVPGVVFQWLATAFVLGRLEYCN